MAEIRIEGKEVIGSDHGHLYIVYVDDNNKELVMGAHSTNRGKFSVLAGDIEVIHGKPLSGSPDDRAKTGDTAEDRGSRVLDLNGRDPAKVYAAMGLYAEIINSAKIEYDLPQDDPLFDVSDTNSNAVVATMLDKVLGIDVADVLPQVNGIDGNFFGSTPDPGGADDIWPGAAGADLIDRGIEQHQTNLESVVTDKLIDLEVRRAALVNASPSLAARIQYEIDKITQELADANAKLASFKAKIVAFEEALRDLNTLHQNDL